MARCLAFSARAASAVFVVSVVISGLLLFSSVEPTLGSAGPGD
jgi:hypothetical protein